MRKFLILLITSLVITLPAIAKAEPNCDEPKDQAEMNFCAAEELKSSDAELNQIYGQVTKDLKADHLEALKKAQTAWIAYRDAACESYSLIAEGGSMQPMMKNLCLSRVTDERVDLLKTQFELETDDEEEDGEEDSDEEGDGEGDDAEGDEEGEDSSDDEEEEKEASKQ